MQRLKAPPRRPDDAVFARVSAASSRPAMTQAWLEQCERSSVIAIRAIWWITLALGRLLLYSICLYYLAFSVYARTASRQYLARVGWARTWLHRHAQAAAVCLLALASAPRSSRSPTCYSCATTTRQDSQMKLAFPAAMLTAALLCACSSDGSFKVKETPQDINVSPRSMDTYDPAARELEKDNQ